jgi:hypothetical protein
MSDVVDEVAPLEDLAYHESGVAPFHMAHVAPLPSADFVPIQLPNADVAPLPHAEVATFDIIASEVVCERPSSFFSLDGTDLAQLLQPCFCTSPAATIFAAAFRIYLSLVFCL